MVLPIADFSSSRYLMVFLFPVLFIGWKIIKRTRFQRAHEIDLVTDLAEIEEYTRLFVEKPERNPFNRVLDKLFG
jgi:amino acid transporter